MNSFAHQRCLVVGGGGFIGTNLCSALVGRFATVRAYGRSMSFPHKLKGTEWQQGDFCDSELLRKAISGCDTVFHLANTNTPASSNKNMIMDLQDNVKNTLRLLDICRDEGVRRVIFLSSGGTIYGIPSVVPTPETAETSPICSYGISKLSIEKYLYLYEHLYGLEHRVIRLSNPYGPYQVSLKNQGVVSAFVSKALNNQRIEVWGDGSVVRDYIYIDDVVDALLMSVFHTGDERVFNIGSGEGVSLRELLQSIENILDKPLQVDYTPSRKIDVPVNVLNIERAHRELNWKANISFIEGLKRTINWHSAHSPSSVLALPK